MISYDAKILVVLLVLLLVPLSGCSGQSGSPATNTATDATTMSTSTTTVQECEAEPPEVSVEVPDRPENLTAETARAVAVTFEKQYKRARKTAVESYNSYVVDRRSNVTEVENGYRVRVTVHEDYVEEVNGQERTVSGAYPTTYLVTEDRFVRNNETLACWD